MAAQSSFRIALPLGKLIEGTASFVKTGPSIAIVFLFKMLTLSIMLDISILPVCLYITFYIVMILCYKP